MEGWRIAADVLLYPFDGMGESVVCSEVAQSLSQLVAGQQDGGDGRQVQIRLDT